MIGLARSRLIRLVAGRRRVAEVVTLIDGQTAA
jgi:hypothetical protein